MGWTPTALGFDLSERLISQLYAAMSEHARRSFAFWRRRGASATRAAEINKAGMTVQEKIILMTSGGKYVEPLEVMAPARLRGERTRPASAHLEGVLSPEDMGRVGAACWKTRGWQPLARRTWPATRCPCSHFTQTAENKIHAESGHSVQQNRPGDHDRPHPVPWGG